MPAQKPGTAPVTTDPRLDRVSRHTLVLAGLAALVGLALRFGFVQPHAIGFICEAAAPPAWCALRHALVLSFATAGLGKAAFALALAALAFDRRLLAAGALVGAALALTLYNAEWGTGAAILALLRLPRP